jgi:hypothetical protein
MIIVVSIVIVLALLAVCAIGVLSIITLDSHRGDPFKKSADQHPTHSEAIARRILGVCVRNEQEGGR